MEQNNSTNTMERMEKLLEKQSKYAKIQCILTAVLVICCLGLIFMAATLLPHIEALVPQVESLMTQMEGTLADLKVITAQLAEADLIGMVEDVNNLVTTSQTGVEQAMDKLNALDFSALNKAISDLSSVIEPLAKFFKLF